MWTHSVQFLKKIPKISLCGSRSLKYIELGHFTLLFCRGRQRNVQRFKTHMHSYSAHQTFCLVTFPFPLPSPSWFAKTPLIGWRLLRTRTAAQLEPRLKNHGYSHSATTSNAKYKGKLTSYLFLFLFIYLPHTIKYIINKHAKDYNK